MYDTPAAIDRKSGIMFINPKLWFKLTPFQRKFIKLHEYGHYYLQTDIEEEADAYAFDRLAGTEHRSMKQCIETLETILDPNRTGHRVRIEALYKRALEWDKKHPMNLKKASGYSNADVIQAVNQVVETSGNNIKESLQVVENKEQNRDNNNTLVYCMLAIAALFLLKN